MKKLFLTLFVALSVLQHPFAQRDSIRTSLLTCQPGKAIYELYGHSAIRVQDFINGRDIVFNYGIFDFSTPHFVTKFTLGRTDYLLGASSLGSFIDEYYERGSIVWSQELNLTPQENARLYRLLLENSLPENRVYRYNFLYGNCATMSIDKIEESIGGKVTYPSPLEGQTIRDILTEHTTVRPWSQFAVDFIIGADADQPLRYREEAFAPQYLMKLVSQATITDSTGTARPLAKDATRLVVPDHSVDFGICLLSPYQVMWMLLMVTVLISMIGWYFRKPMWLFDVILFSVQGIVGIIVTVMFFFSEHPAVGSNWLIAVFNPLPLFFIPALVRHFKNRQPDWFLAAEFVICTIFVLAGGLIPQGIEPAVIIAVCAFPIRALSSGLFLLTRHRKLKLSRGASVAAIACLLMPFSNKADAKTAGRPKLVIGITIDQLDGESLQILMHKLSDNGLKKIWHNGYVRTDVSFDFDGPDKASATAAIYTGASPFQNGIVAETWFNRRTLLAMPLVDDSRFMGNGTIECSSPARLQASTLADELKLATDGKSKVCSIAIDREVSVLAAGHEADVALWMNPDNCNWCTSDYYGGVPAWVDNPKTQNWSHETWEPVLPIPEYIHESANVTDGPFAHTVSRTGAMEYKTTPFANTEVTRMAVKAIEQMEMGMDDITDLLAVEYYAGNFRHQPASVRSLELQDIYIRLDQEIATLTGMASELVGKDNILVFISSTGYLDQYQPDLSGTRIPNGTVSMERVTALLNLYLSAKYDHTGMAEAYYHNHIYLNHQLLEDAELELHSVLESCVDLLVQVSGVKSVILPRDLMATVPNSESARIRNSLHQSCSGDIILQPVPGWKISDENEGRSIYQKPTGSSFPVMLYGAGIRAEIDHNPISASFLAPTVANLIHTTVPNACSTPAIKGLKQ